MDLSLIILISGIFILGIVFGTVFKKKMSFSDKNKLVGKVPENTTPLPEVISNALKNNNLAELNKNLIQEVNSLRQIVKELRAKLDSLQKQSKELESINRELVEQNKKLSKIKIQLEELHVQKDELFAMVVHDIKNPAGLIKNLSELLLSYDLTAKEQHEIMQTLINTSSKIIKLAQDISVSIAKDSQMVNYEFKKVSIEGMIEQIYYRNVITARRKNIILQKFIPKPLPVLTIDEKRVEEALENLVDNAIKFSPRNGFVKVRAYQNNSSIVIEVKDKGEGLTTEEIAKAFKKGVTLSTKPTGDETSSGLGLWIVKKIIENHGGEVFIKSEKGKGSIFGFTLPIK